MAEKTKKKAELAMTPATMAKDLQVGTKLNSFEQSLEDMYTSEQEVEDIEQQLVEICSKAGHGGGWSKDYYEHNLVVYKKSKYDKKIINQVNLLGSYIDNLFGNESRAYEVKAIIGEEAYSKLERFGKLYRQGEINHKEVDEKASKELWDQYVDLIVKYKAAAKKKRYAQAKVSKAKNFVDYANNLADIAKKTKDMQ